MTAFEDKNPVIFIEHTALYALNGEVPDEAYSRPVRQGEDRARGQGRHAHRLSGSVHQAFARREAARSRTASTPRSSTCARCARSTSEAILASVKKTNRAVVVEDAWQFGGFAGEIARDDPGARLRLSRRARHALRPASTYRCRTPARSSRQRCRRKHEIIRARTRRWCRSDAMITEVVMPQMGADMKEGTIVTLAQGRGRRRQARRDHRRDRDRQGQHRDRGLRAAVVPQGARRAKATSCRSAPSSPSSPPPTTTSRSTTNGDSAAPQLPRASPVHRTSARTRAATSEARPAAAPAPARPTPSPSPRSGYVAPADASASRRSRAASRSSTGIDPRTIRGSGPRRPHRPPRHRSRDRNARAARPTKATAPTHQRRAVEDAAGHRAAHVAEQARSAPLLLTYGHRHDRRHRTPPPAQRRRCPRASASASTI